jgi:hypothetical protein
VCTRTTNPMLARSSDQSPRKCVVIGGDGLPMNSPKLCASSSCTGMIVFNTIVHPRTHVDKQARRRKDLGQSNGSILFFLGECPNGSPVQLAQPTNKNSQGMIKNVPLE